MGNLNTPGVVKFWWKNELVETPYKNIHEIPVIDINKRETRIAGQQQDIAILHFSDSAKSAEIVQKIKLNNTLVYAVPNQNSK